MCSVGIALFLIGVLSAKKEITAARGLDKIVALSSLCFAIPLAVFGAEHFSEARSIMAGVPVYMPWRLFWAYVVGCALIAASLSIATQIKVRWSGLLFGIMMLLFVAMIHIPTALAHPHNRLPWMIVLRETSFGGAGFILAGSAVAGWSEQVKSTLVTVGRILIGIVLVIFGAEHFLHATGLPGVPLAKQMPTWIPGSVLVGYLTGAALIAAGGSILLNRKTRTGATWLGSWILLLVLVIYGPVLILALSEPDAAAKVEGINYFADTLLFSGAILALARATPDRPGDIAAPVHPQ
jgi:uncharacterized membrane protein